MRSCTDPADRGRITSFASLLYKQERASPLLEHVVHGICRSHRTLLDGQLVSQEEVALRVVHLLLTRLTFASYIRHKKVEVCRDVG